jgi:hypothetical protein
MSTDPDWAYRHHPQSPDYEDPAEGLDDLDDEQLEDLLDRAVSVAEDPDVSAQIRRECDEATTRIEREMARRAVAS